MLRLYRILFFLNVIIMLFGALLKITHIAIGFLNGNSLMFIGKLFSALVLLIAYFLMLKSTQMKVVEKAIWMLLFGVVFVFLEGLIILLPGLLFYLIGIKRLFSKE
ncbi:hypothetical protein EG240_14235 [Paenimyroides tangerinum]|uniref:Uncharacterized protein n=1 Tax=Paenimyroides tangerinum TaxID=2488728 RepID=A0A3P3W5T9_9FLAO|nr:hypothetical protein [Paenimyroides tangerinum]RRJ88033.1 hypothetical protein EG240_14235 [Paenimyroides tangerinum]